MNEKFSYSLDYLIRKYRSIPGIVVWGKGKAQELQAKHGLPFDHNQGISGTYQFSPYYDETTPVVNDPAILEAVLAKCKNQRYTTNFILLAKETGLSLQQIAGAAKFLVTNQYALVGYNIEKHPASIRWFPGACKVYGDGAAREYANLADLLKRTRLVRGRA